MRIINRKLSVAEFSEYLSVKQFGSLPPTSLVIHHTWKPRQSDWRGEYSIDGLKRYYEGKGWPVGPHIFVADDGIWLFTDMYNVGIHSGKGNATYVHDDGRVYNGYSVPSSVNNSTKFKLKEYSIGVEVVGDYDNKLWSGDTKRNALYCIDMLQKKLNIKNSKVMFHREFSPKTCPGNAITKDWLFNQLKGLQYSGGSNTEDNDNQSTTSDSKYKIKYDSISVTRAMNLGILNKVDSEVRELIAIASMRTIDYLERRMDSLENKIKALRN